MGKIVSKSDWYDRVFGVSRHTFWFGFLGSMIFGMTLAGTNYVGAIIVALLILLLYKKTRAA